MSAISRGLLIARSSSRIGLRSLISARGFRVWSSSTNRRWRDVPPSQSPSPAPCQRRRARPGSDRGLGRRELGIDDRGPGRSGRRCAGRDRSAGIRGCDHPASIRIASSGCTSSTPVSRFTSSASSAESTFPSARSSRSLRGGRYSVARRATVEPQIRARCFDAAQVVEGVVLPGKVCPVGQRHALDHGNTVADPVEELRPPGLEFFGRVRLIVLRACR